MVQQVAEPKGAKLTSSPLDKEDGSNQPRPASSSVELHYVQEKPPRPMPRQRKSKQARDRTKSIADLSTTDTSLISSENEDAVKPMHVRTQAFQFVNENELNNRPKSKPQMPMYKRVQVKHDPQQLSSFDSDSDVRQANA